MPAHEYIWLRMVATRRVTAQVCDAFIDHTRRQMDEAERRVGQQHDAGGGDEGEEWG